MDRQILIDTLKRGIAEAQWEGIAEPAVLKMIEYVELLHKWNSVHNLTAIRDPLEMVKRHVLDSLVLLPYVSQGRILDVGTGAGVPGIPLALARPELSFVLVDSNQKKINFVEHVILSLKLPNVVVVCKRIEAYQSENLFDFVLSRAFASLSQFVQDAAHLCKPDGRFIAMKGVIESAKVETPPFGYTLEKIVSVSVPGLNAKRSLVFVMKNKKEAH